MTVQSILLSTSFLMLSLLGVGSLSIYSQTTAVEVPAPRLEKFAPVADFLTPWVNSRCPMPRGDYIPDLDCTREMGPDRDAYQRVEIYNPDGTLWYQFSVIPRESDSFIKPGTADSPKRKDFVPFKIDTWNHRDAPAQLVLRIVGESPNWYEIEINENTQETRFAPKNPPRMWKRTTGSFWLYWTVTLIIGKGTKILNAPEGEVNTEMTDLDLPSVQFVRADGDWALVEQTVSSRRYTGWIRWRKGRSILVGCDLNDKKPLMNDSNP